MTDKESSASAVEIFQEVTKLLSTVNVIQLETNRERIRSLLMQALLPDVADQMDVAVAGGVGKLLECVTERRWIDALALIRILGMTEEGPDPDAFHLLRFPDMVHCGEEGELPRYFTDDPAHVTCEDCKLNPTYVFWARRQRAKEEE